MNIVERSKIKCKIPANVRVGYVIDRKQGFNKVNDKAFSLEIGDRMLVTYTDSNNKKVTETLSVNGIVESSDYDHYQIFLDRCYYSV